MITRTIVAGVAAIVERVFDWGVLQIKQRCGSIGSRRCGILSEARALFSEIQIPLVYVAFG